MVENLLRGVGNLLGAVEAVANVMRGTAAGSLVGALGVGTESDGGSPGVLTVLDAAPAGLLLAAYIVLFAATTLALVRLRDIT